MYAVINVEYQRRNFIITYDRHTDTQTLLGYSRRYPKYSRLTYLLHLTSSSSSRGSGVPGDYQVTSPFAVLPLAWQRSINRLWQGGEWEFISISPLPTIPNNALIPSIGLISPPSSLIFLVLPYLPTSKLIQMSQDPLPYPPQMRNGGSPLAHLSLSADSRAAVERAVATTAADSRGAFERALVTTAAAIMAAMDLALEKMWAAMLAVLAAAKGANKQRRHKNAAREKALANNAEAQCRRESAERAAALAESVSAAKQSHQESADCAAVSAK